MPPLWRMWRQSCWLRSPRSERLFLVVLFGDCWLTAFRWITSHFRRAVNFVCKNRQRKKQSQNVKDASELLLLLEEEVRANGADAPPLTPDSLQHPMAMRALKSDDDALRTAVTAVVSSRSLPLNDELLTAVGDPLFPAVVDTQDIGKIVADLRSMLRAEVWFAMWSSNPGHHLQALRNLIMKKLAAKDALIAKGSRGDEQQTKVDDAPSEVDVRVGLLNHAERLMVIAVFWRLCLFYSLYTQLVALHFGWGAAEMRAVVQRLLDVAVGSAQQNLDSAFGSLPKFLCDVCYAIHCLRADNIDRKTAVDWCRCCRSARQWWI